MQHLLHHIQQRLKTRKLYHQAAAQIILQYLKPKAIDPTLLHLKLRGLVCELSLGPEEDKTARYLAKKNLLLEINKKLSDDGRELVLKELKIC